MGARKTVGCGLLAVLVAGCGVCAVSGLAAGPTLTYLARQRLHEAGVSCDDRLAIGIAPSAAALTASPTYCRIAEGPIEAVELLAPAEFAPSGADTLRQVVVPDVRVTLRDSALPRLDATSPLAGALSAVAVPERTYGLLQAVAALASYAELPRMEIGRLEVVRAGATMATMTGGTIEGPAPIRAQIARVAMPVFEGPFGVRAEAALTALEISSDGSEATLSGALELDGALPFVGGRLASQRLTVHASGLDGGAPSVRITSP